MPRGLDHIVHAVADLDAAADFYRRCGFQVGARNRHPWGTHNHVIQLPGFFIEVLTVAEPDKLGSDGLSKHFGAFQRDAIARRDGLSMLLVESKNISADVVDFQRSGIGSSEALPFERQATMPDGSTAIVGFSLAFARHPLAPEVGFAACQQHNPDAFWNAVYQRHANGVTSLGGVVVAAQRPRDHIAFLRALTGAADAERSLEGAVLRTPRGEIEVQQPEALGRRIGEVPACGEGGVLAALRMSVGSLDELEHRLRSHHVPIHRSEASLTVPPTAAFGAALIFEQAALS